MDATRSLAAPVTLNPTADTFVSSANPGNNYGGAGALEVSATGLPKGEFQSLMKFDTSSAKTSFDAAFGANNWSLSSAILTLTAASPNNAIFNTSAAGNFTLSYMVNSGWTEGTGNPNSPTTTGLTYNTLSSFLSSGDQTIGAFSFAGGTSGASMYTLSVPLPSSMDSAILSGNTISLRVFAADSSVSYLFNSRSGASAPVLSLSAAAGTPEPSSLAFMAVSVTGLLARRRRR